MKKLSILLKSNKKYLLLFILIIIYSLLYCYFFEREFQFKTGNFDEEIIVDNFKITENKIEIKFKNGIANYYFKNDNDRMEKSELISFGNVLAIKGELVVPSSNTIPNLFNYKRYLIFQEVDQYIKIEGIELKGYQNNFKYQIQRYLFKRTKSFKYSSYFQSLILGYKSNFDNNLKDTFLDTGLSHILSLSGLHVGLIVFLLKYFYSLFFKIIELIDLSIIISLFCYALISFSSLSIHRAILMYTIYTLAKWLRIKLEAIDILFVTGIILLVYNPLSVNHLGFIFSFLTVFFILMSKVLLKSKNTLINGLKLSCIAFLATFPVVVNANYQINFFTPIINTIVVPIFSIIVYPFTIFTFIFHQFEFLYNYIIESFEQLVIILENNLNGIIIFGKVNTMFITIYFITLIFFLISVESKRNIIISGVIFTLSLSLAYFDKDISSYGRVVYLDVGQGDSTLIDLPNRKGTILIDTGGVVGFNKYLTINTKYSIAKSKTIPYLKSIGVTKINYLILTHGDYDHLGEATNLIDNFKIDNIYINCNAINNLEKMIIDKFPASKAKSFIIGNHHFQVRSCENNNDENDSSVVLTTKLFDKDFYFGGDISKSFEDDFEFNIDFLKVSHHGSKTSTSELFIKNVRPEYAFISCGKNNFYSHPNKQIIDILDKYSVRTYRTDNEGTIEIIFSNQQYLINVYPH